VCVVEVEIYIGESFYSVAAAEERRSYEEAVGGEASVSSKRGSGGGCGLVVVAVLLLPSALWRGELEEDPALLMLLVCLVD